MNGMFGGPMGQGPQGMFGGMQSPMMGGLDPQVMQMLQQMLAAGGPSATPPMGAPQGMGMPPQVPGMQPGGADISQLLRMLQSGGMFR